MRIPRLPSKASLLIPLSALLLALTACTSAAQEPPMPRSAGLHSWYENGTGGRYVMLVIQGSVKSLALGSRAGTVLTDANCAPDSQGLNHCHNIIRFRDGSQITIQNNHQMMRHRCLQPGETVRVSRLAGRWVTIQTSH